MASQIKTQIGNFLFFGAMSIALTWQACGGFRAKVVSKQIHKLESLNDKDLKAQTTGYIQVMIGEKFPAPGSHVGHEETFEIAILTPQERIVIEAADPSQRARFHSGDLVALTRNPKSNENTVFLKDTQTKTLSETSFQVETLSAPFYGDENLGDQKTLVVTTNPIQGTKYPIDNSLFANRFFSEGDPLSLANFVKTNSYGQSTVSGKLVGPLVGPECYDLHTTEAAQSVIRQLEDYSGYGVNIRDYSRLVILLPDYPQCDGWNWGTIGKSTWYLKKGTHRLSVTWAYAYQNPDTSAYIFHHEFGHNLGLLHAGAVDGCSSNDFSSPDCNLAEYGDIDNVMGSSWDTRVAKFSAANREQAGWLSETSRIFEPTSSTDIYLSKIQATPVSGMVQHLKIPMARSAFKWFYFSRPFISVEYSLQPDAPESENGVHIRFWGERERTVRINYLPNSNMHNPGDLFIEPMTGTRIILMERTSDYVRLRLQKFTPMRSASDMPTVRSIKTAQQVFGPSRSCADLVVDVESPDPSQTWLGLMENGTASYAFAPVTDFVDLDSKTRRFIVSKSGLDYRKSYTATPFIQNAAVLSQSVIVKPWSCNEQLTRLSIPAIASASEVPWWSNHDCRNLVVQAKLTNAQPGEPINVMLQPNRVNSTNEEIKSCTATTDSDGNAWCEVTDANPNDIYSLNVSAGELWASQLVGRRDCVGYDNAPEMSFAFRRVRPVSSFTGGVSTESVSRRVSEASYDPCSQINVYLTTKNIPAGTTITAKAKDADTNSYECSGTVENSGIVRCTISGLSKSTRYIIEADYQAETRFLFWKTTETCAAVPPN